MVKTVKKQKTYVAKPKSVEQKWFLIDAEGQILGRLASKIANILRGKNKVEFTPHIDTGDYVVVVNADKIKYSGNKAKQKLYYSHSGYPGGLKSIALEYQLKKDASQVILKAVKGMLPHNRLGRKLLTKCKVFNGTEHNLAAQKPELLKI